MSLSVPDQTRADLDAARRRLEVLAERQRIPKKFLEAIRRNPELTLDEYAFVKQHATLVREVAIQAQRGGKVSYHGDLVDGVLIMGGQGLTALAFQIGRNPSGAWLNGALAATAKLGLAFAVLLSLGAALAR